MTHLSIKPGSGKPVPRVHLLQGKAAALPMHMVRPAFAPVPPAKVDANHGAPRNPDNVTPAALLLLAERELTRDQLDERLQVQFPAGGLMIDKLVLRLVRESWAALDSAGLIGLTTSGASKAARIKRDRGANIGAHHWRTLGPKPTPHPDMVAKIVQHATRVQGAGSQPRMQSSVADTRTPPTRAGADDGLQLPSRVNDRLHYRSGLVTDLHGNVLQAAPTGEKFYRPTHSGEERARQVYPSNH